MIHSDAGGSLLVCRAWPEEASAIPIKLWMDGKVRPLESSPGGEGGGFGDRG